MQISSDDIKFNRDEYTRPPRRVAVVHVPGFISHDEGETIVDMIQDNIADCGVIIMDGGKRLDIFEN